MPSTGTPASKTNGSHRGDPSASTEAGPPDRMIPRGAKRRGASAGRARRGGQEDAARGEAADVVRRQVRPVDLAVHPQLPHAARDELRVLTAKIEDEDLLGVNVHHTLQGGAR